MKEIPLINTDMVALVNDEDYEEISKYDWNLTSNGYVRSYTPLFLHRFILKAPRNLDVDHKNNNPLDNQRENIRISTRSQNCANARKRRCAKSSKYKGVCWREYAHKWMAVITVNRKFIYLGYFTSETAAAIAYDLAALKYFREFSKLNFPERITIE
jgi:hypothetical protein